MFTQQTARRNITLVTAFAVIWVFLSGLLNFHAHRILGTELIDHINPAIKPKSKENTVQFSELTQKSKFQNYTLTKNFDLSEILLPAALVKRQNIAIFTFAEVRSFQFGMRAPPSL